MENLTITDSIRECLRAATTPLTVKEVHGRMTRATDLDTVGALLIQRYKAGEFSKLAAENGKSQYTLNPEYVRRVGMPAPKPKRPTVQAQAVTPRPETPSPPKTKTPPPAKKPPALSERKRDFLAAAEDAQRVLKALEFNHSTASDALDLYVASVVDADIYNALKRSANDAQMALNAFVAGGRP